MAEKHKDELSGVETTGHVWDNDLRELNNPLPKWWLYVLYVTIIWSVGYYIFFPSWPLLDSYTKGIWNWSSREEVAQELADAKAAQSKFWVQVDKAKLTEIKANPELLQFARAGGAAAFGDNCAGCHGTGAAGAKGYPNLNDDDWIWGGTVEDIHQTLLYGVRHTYNDTRQSEMPAFGKDGILEAVQIRDVAGYVRSLSGLKTEGVNIATGQALYAENCAACHGDGGEGNRELGSPNLKDGIWLYGSDMATLVETITYSRAGVMPGWNGRLPAPTIKALAVYVHSLGGGE